MKTSNRRSALAALSLGLLLFCATEVYAQAAEFCWSETWGRGAGAIPTTCGADQDKNGALCYSKCPTGYKSDGVAGCIQTCPAGATDDGLFCGWSSYKAAEYPIWDEAKCKSAHGSCWLTVPLVGVWVETCKTGFHHVAGFCEKESINCQAEGLKGDRIANSCAKNLTFRTAVSPSCESGKDLDAGLCYTSCSNGGRSGGPMCWGVGPPGWVQCGAGWAATKSACDNAITDQVLTVVDTVASTAMLIASMGGSAASKAGETVWKKAAWESIKKIGKQNVKKVLIETTVANAVTGTADIARDSSNATIDYLWELGELEEAGNPMTQVEKDFAITQAALSAASWLDPTGVTGLVAAYAKPVCKDVSAMTATRSLDAPSPIELRKQPSGSLVQLMASPQVIQSNFAQQIATLNGQYAAAAAQLTQAQMAQQRAPTSAQAAAGVAQASAQQQRLAQQLGAVQAASQKFNAVVPKWSQLTAANSNKTPGTYAGTTPSPAPAPAAPAPAGWRDAGFRALDVAAGANGALWYIGADGPGNVADKYIYQVTASGTRRVDGWALRIAVDPVGTPWVINSTNNIFRWTGSGWQQMVGAARDVGIGANGAVWVIGMDGTPYRWGGTNWVAGTGKGSMISVDPNGNPWVINSANQIWRYTGTAWQLLSGAGRDIGISADGTVYVVGTGTTTGGSQVWRWAAAQNTWIAEPGIIANSVSGSSGSGAYAARSLESNLSALVRSP